MPYFQTPNATLYYELLEPDVTMQPRPIVLLLHGYASTPESDFAGQLPSLHTRYRVLAPHLHGYGRSSHRTSYSINYYRQDAADMIALLDALHLEQALVMAFSDGGIVGLVLAALYPNRVQALAVLGAQPTVNSQDAAAIRHWFLEVSLSEDKQAQMAELHGEPYWRSLAPMYVAAQEALVAAGGVLITDDELASIRCPTLIMHGVRDRVVSADYAHILQEHIPGSQLLLFDAGHAAHLRCKQEYTKTVMDFFRQVEKLL
jgi:valacyclovir hydrolase